MSPKLKPLLLPQLVEQRKRSDSASQVSSPDPNVVGPWPYGFPATNSSSSDITSPVTPTFSTRGHVRMSSSSSSLDLPPLAQDGYVSPSLLSSTLTKASARQLPDVQEEPLEKDYYQHIDDDLSDDDEDNFGLYSCLCDDVGPRGNSSEDLFDGALVGEFDIDDYDVGFLSDGDVNVHAPYGKKKRAGIESQLSGLTARLESRFPNITRWRSGRHSRMTNPGPMEYSLGNVLSRAPSSRSSSISALARHNTDGNNEHSIPPTPALPFGSTDSVNVPSLTPIFTEHDKTSLQRDRAMATTPLLPPLMTDPLGKPPPQSPLQSPTIESAPTPLMLSSAAQSPPLTSAAFARPSLSSRPSAQSLRNISSSTDLPLPLPVSLPSILQEHDEWSDRLGHANFTISPAPYDLQTVNPDTIAKFSSDWDAARCNYTKHLVRTGENYGQTSKIYALTEAKWAETERRWRSIYEDTIRQTFAPVPMQKSDSRSRSRGRGRGRSLSAHPGSVHHSPQGDAFAGVEWKRLEDNMPSAVPQILEVLDAAQGKFPNRGDEDIVGPMHREASMAGAYNEDSRSRFWKSLGAKVGIHR
ncbi:only proline and serine are matching in the corresponding protein [Cordyceps javanica]|uniref:Only proline and serine are matching in the corresponding protein n=1 Tax=Cordyceps javanica TaxID=43265 RepID=A0A545VVA9_9HYPO|nr:only proline and serine are matching in the corresponding protein [Cordyceps javanica]TQW05647.1 only proline and serine are matching in the corresponding protein [Cordyceps javanica]